GCALLRVDVLLCSPLRFPRPPSSTPFPYTTLFRSAPSRRDCSAFHRTSMRRPGHSGKARSRRYGGSTCRFWCRRSAQAACWSSRSEEHTSELQSRENLVCRLLLEKKKKVQKPYTAH